MVWFCIAAVNLPVFFRCVVPEMCSLHMIKHRQKRCVSGQDYVQS